MKKLLYIFLMSLLPISELRGAIILAAAMTPPIKWYIALPVCIVANLIPVPFVLWLIRKIIAYMHTMNWKFANKIADWLDKKAARGVAKMKNASFVGLLLLVAVPLPFTGAWTGSLVASTLGMDKKKSFATIALGVLIAGIIMTLASYGAVAGLAWLKNI